LFVSIYQVNSVQDVVCITVLCWCGFWKVFCAVCGDRLLHVVTNAFRQSYFIQQVCCCMTHLHRDMW